MFCTIAIVRSNKRTENMIAVIIKPKLIINKTVILVFRFLPSSLALFPSKTKRLNEKMKKIRKGAKHIMKEFILKILQNSNNVIIH